MEAKFGREHDAIRYYDAAIKTSPNCMPAVHGLRDLYRRREEWPRVIETLELEVKLWSDDKERAGVFAQIGRIYDQQLNDPERAMHYYESALTVDPDCLPANQALFEHFFDRGDWDKAMPIATSLAQKAMRDGDPTDAQRLLSQARRRREEHRRRSSPPPTASSSRSRSSRSTRPPSTTSARSPATIPTRGTSTRPTASSRRSTRSATTRGPLLARVMSRAQRSSSAKATSTAQRRSITRRSRSRRPTSRSCNALVEFHTDMRHWKQAVEAIQQFVDGAPRPERSAERADAPGRDPRRRRDGRRSARSRCSVT